MAQDAAVNELVITGTVKNKDSRKKLENVNVSVVGNNIGTVTNADGTFSLKLSVDWKSPISAISLHTSLWKNLKKRAS